MLLAIADDFVRSGLPVLYFSTGDTAHREQFLTTWRKNGARADTIPRSALNQAKILPGALLLVDCAEGQERVEAGQPGEHAGRLAYAALYEAAGWIQARGCVGLLTAPVAKEWIARGIGADFPGHTDFLARRFSVPVMMLMHGRALSVVPLTIHIPLYEVPHALRIVLEDQATVDLLRQVLNTAPFHGTRWALCGLNPHAGEGGQLGREEIDFMESAATRLRAGGLPVDGPLPADGLFMPEVRSRYRLILACYHDQGLAPFKALEGWEGVNCTIGLPFLRSSPDHGTAFSLAGRGKADARSMRQALRVLLNQELAPLAGRRSA